MLADGVVEEIMHLCLEPPLPFSAIDSGDFVSVFELSKWEVGEPPVFGCEFGYIYTDFVGI